MYLSMKKSGGRWKTGSVALRFTSRVVLLDSKADARDVEYRPSTSFSMPGGRTMRTRHDRRKFWNVANNLTTLQDKHSPDDEAQVFLTFSNQIRPKLTTKYLALGQYYESENAVWMPRLLRYKGMSMRSETISRHAEKEFWRKNNGCPSTMAKWIGELIKTMKLANAFKPICILVGQRQYLRREGHCVMLVLVPSPEGWQAFVKDSMPIQLAVFKTLVMTILPRIPFIMPKLRFCYLAGMVKEDVFKPNTDCFKEGLKFVADVLDGKKFWLDISLNEMRKFDVIAKKEIK